MVTRAVKNADDLALLKVELDERKRPFTVEVTDGRDRSTEQNKLAFKWYGEISNQTGEEVEDIRARCKLEIGIPILRAADEKFREVYDGEIRDLPYERKLRLIRRLDIPVTRLMSVPQMTEYLDTVYRHHVEFGITLTIPPDKYAFDPDRARKAA